LAPTPLHHVVKELAQIREPNQRKGSSICVAFYRPVRAA
jgi:hypothetical protein